MLTTALSWLALMENHHKGNLQVANVVCLTLRQ